MVARWQLLKMGFSEAMIKRLVASGHLVRVHRGVYAVGHDRLTAHGRWMAAVLAYGRSAVLSHRTAAALWDLSRSSSGRIEVTADRQLTKRRGISVHLSRRLDTEDRTTRDGIPVTSVHRSLLDLAEVVPRQRLEDALEAAERLNLLDVRALRSVIARSPGRRGLKPLRAFLSDHHDHPAETKSELEKRFLRFCKANALPLPATNVVVEGHEVDCYWPDRNLVIELDSFEFHTTRAAFERDRNRPADLLLAGYRSARVTSRRLDHPEGLLELISSATPSRA